ncbi:hypothetical protein CCACVL1_23090 [Corchorus capsularis]|uniref:C2H2-type domain-containing protein n=1 Tax=Corchorus capsularis TaxID=210143 RepID=A0A1R3GV49_COCAP|nr:hypothetical protein CCACVL1_23090 [Corchorus capsularis]
MEESEKAEQETSSEEQGQGARSPARSYECTFCKRGFSNAQALGGHMNIHRRDKAKLKQAHNSSSETNYSPHQSNLDNINVIPKSIIIPSSYSPTETTPGKWPWVNDHDHHDYVVDDHDHNKRPDKTHVGEIRKLPLFDEKPSSITQENILQPAASTTQVDEKGSSSSDDQVDLELRLGPDPQDSSPTITTKKFF